MTSTLSALAFLLLTCVFARLLRNFWRLRKVPGPPLAAFTDLWRFRLQYRMPIAPTLLELHSIYGDVVRTGPNTVCIRGQQFVKKVFDNRGEFKKADSYKPMRAFSSGRSVGSMIDMQDEDQNRALRKAIGGAFLAKNLHVYEQDADVAIRSLIRRIKKHPVFSLYNTLQLFQLDFLFKIAFSESPGHLTIGEDVLGLAKLGNRRVSHWYSWQAMPQLEHFLFHNAIWGEWLAQTSKWAEMGIDRLETRRRLAKLEQITMPQDLLQQCIGTSSGHAEILKPESIVSLVNSIISAGADTTAGTLSTIIYFLLKNPTCYAAVVAELLETNVTLATPYSSLKVLPYLDAVVKEALRLNPPLALPLERVVPERGCEIGGIHLPKGTIVGCLALAVHLDGECYGEEARSFRPERWIGRSSNERIAMERNFLSWGSGSRMCLGKHIAELELKKALAALLLTFNMELTDPAMTMPFQMGILEFETKHISVKFIGRDLGEEKVDKT